MIPSGRGTGVNGSQVNQSFIVTYTDGTTATFIQSISDWAIPKGYTGESTALTTAYRDTYNGTEQAGTVTLYEYTFTLDPDQVGPQHHPAQGRQRRGVRRHACPRGRDASQPLLGFQPGGDRGRRDAIQRGRARRRRLCPLLQPSRDDPDRRRHHLQPRPRRAQRRRQRRRADHRAALGQRQRAQAAGDRRQRQPGEPDLHRDLHRRDDGHVHPVAQRLGHTAGVRRGVRRR